MNFYLNLRFFFLVTARRSNRLNAIANAKQFSNTGISLPLKKTPTAINTRVNIKEATTAKCFESRLNLPRENPEITPDERNAIRDAVGILPVGFEEKNKKMQETVDRKR